MNDSAPIIPVLQQRIITAEKILDDIKGDIKDTRTDQKVLQSQLIEVHKAVLLIGKPQYAVISAVMIVALGITGGLWKLAIDPVNADIGRLYSENQKLSIKLEDTIKLFDAKKEDRSDIEGLRADLKARIEELTNRLRGR